MEEIEVKFVIEDVSWLEKRLKKAGAKQEGTFAQKDIWFTSSSRYFKSKGLGLRLRRQGKTTTMTLKEAVKTDHRFRYAKEIEFVVGDPAGAEKLIRELGYEEDYRMRKRRSVWKLDGLEIVIDVVENLGTFVELEGTEEEIEEGIKKLGLETRPRITKHYGQLFVERQNNGG